ncbi:hypothetical protein [Flagellimonas sp. GZD32]|uniref:hypothetical protein n=1 Tax=Flagellimonas cixiensis TaxID=3228750 RepID=UPI0035C8B186
MLTENEIVEKVADFLESRGYLIKQRLTTNQQGIDLIAESQNEKLYIEAKGETSALKTSSRYGQPFNRSQVKSHIGLALWATMKVISSEPAGKKTKAGIALPDNKEHRKVIEIIYPALKKLGIKLFWVTKSHVTIE